MQLSELAQRAVKEAYAELTVAQKRAWNLCKRQGLSEEEASIKLNVSRSAVKARLIWAAKKFKKHLEQIRESNDA